jgi:hypothetical protein
MRNGKGQFAPGNPGGPGRPTKLVEGDYRDAVREAVTVADLCAVLKSLTGKAKRGDVQAAKLLLSYTVGLPTQHIEQSVTRRPGEVGMAEMLALAQNPELYGNVEPLLPPECYGPPPDGDAD